jgi:putative salt-induced outer membrane protein
MVPAQMRILICLLFTLLFSLPLPAQENADLQKELEKLREEKRLLQQELADTAARAETLEKRLIAMEEQRQKASTPSGSDVSPVQEAPNPWDAEFSLGANLSSGNNDSSRLEAALKAVRTTELDKLTFGLQGEVGQNEGETNAQRAEAVADYQRDIDPTWYWYINAKGEHDDIAGLDYRVTVGPGLGWHIIQTDTISLDLEGGPAWVAEQLEGGPLEHSLRGRIAQHFEWRFSKAAKLYQELEFLENLQDFDDWILVGEIGIESNLTETLSLRVSAEDRYDNEPAEGRQRNDIFLKSAVVYKFK